MYEEELEMMEKQNIERVKAEEVKKKDRVKIVNVTPDIRTLKVGDVYSDYKHLCERLGENHRAGNSKKSHTKHWERFFSFEKEGRKLKITAIYHSPKDKIDFRSRGGNNVKYIDKIEYLILHLLAKEKDKFSVLISKGKLLESLDMVNSNYHYGKYNIEKISNYTSIPNKSVDHFYDTTDNVLKRNVQSALISLEQKSLIFYNEVVTISIAETDAIVNKGGKVSANRKVEILPSGRRKSTFTVDSVNVDTVVRKATDEEANNILVVKKSVLKEFGYKKENEAFVYGKTNEFYGRVNKLLFDNYNIDMYFMSYEITFNRGLILEEKKNVEDWIIEESKRIASVIELNNDVVNRLEENLLKRQDDAVAKLIETDKEEFKFRLTSEYVDEQKALMSIMIMFDSEILEDIIERTLL